MNFLYPGILGGLAAVSVPVVIHLLNRLQVKNVDWAAMRFLRDSVRKNQRRVRMEDLILLMLRCLFVVLLVLAFARPVVKARARASEGGNSGQVAVVVLLDNSASMAQSAGAGTRFSQAKAQAREWLGHLGGGSRAALFLVSDQVEPLVAKPSPDLALVGRLLETAQPAERGTDLPRALRQAYETLAEVQGLAREIRIYTDGQSTAWPRLEEVKALAREHPDIRLTPVLIGSGGEANAGVVSLQVEGGAPAAGVPLRVLVEVGNFGPAALENLRLSLAMDGQAVNETVVASIPAGATQTVPMIVTFAAPGPHLLTASLPPDALPADNQRTAAVEVIRQLNVLIAEGGEADNDLDRDGYFLAHALLPLGRERARQYYLEARFTRPAQMTADALVEADMVFFCDPGAIDPGLAGALRDFVERRGNLVIFPGPLTQPAQWSANEAWSALLPAKLGPLSADRPLAWQSADFEHPVTSLWNDPAQGTLGSVKFRQYFPLLPKENASAIVRYTDGQPAAVEWRLGHGGVVLFGSSATPEWNNLCVHPAFVPVIQRLMGYLSRRDETQLALAPGQTFVKEVPEEWRGKDFTVQGPADAAPRVAGQVLADGGRTFLRYAGTVALGGYRVFLGDQPLASFAVQLPSEESDLRPIDAAKLTKLAEPAPGHGASAPAYTFISKEFWTALVWAALLLALAETALAHRLTWTRQV